MAKGPIRYCGTPILTLIWWSDLYLLCFSFSFLLTAPTSYYIMISEFLTPGQQGNPCFSQELIVWYVFLTSGVLWLQLTCLSDSAGKAQIPSTCKMMILLFFFNTALFCLSKIYLAGLLPDSMPINAHLHRGHAYSKCSKNTCLLNSNDNQKLVVIIKSPQTIVGNQKRMAWTLAFNPAA